MTIRFERFYVAAFVPWIAVGTQWNPWPHWPSEVKIKVGSSDCQTGQVYRAKVAQATLDQQKGLSHRKAPLRTDEAMIFVYPTAGPKSFWMKETWIPLSVFFFAQDGKLLSSHEMKVESDPSHPKQIYSEAGAVSVVLETTYGMATQLSKSDVYLCAFAPIP